MNDIIHVARQPLTRAVYRHAHDCWELIYCTRGTGTLAFNGKSLDYKRGDVVVIPPQLIHSNTDNAGFENIYVRMRAPSFTMKEPVIVSDDEHHFLLDAFTAAHHHFQSTRKERTAFLAAYGNLISCYLAAYQTAYSHRNVVEEIQRDIWAHYGDCDYRLDAYLRSLPFSYDYIRKLFQKETGMTPHKFLNDLRLQTAVGLLVSADGSAIADISHRCGFREPLYFSRMFKKKYGIAPSGYLEHQATLRTPEITVADEDQGTSD